MRGREELTAQALEVVPRGIDFRGGAEEAALPLGQEEEYHMTTAPEGDAHVGERRVFSVGEADPDALGPAGGIWGI